MDGFVRWIRGFIQELRRRRVIRVAVVYAGTAFVILQLGEILVEPFNLPGWTLRLITLALILGFPLAVGLAWVFDVTEEGLVRTEAEEKAPGELGPGGKPFTSDAVIIGLLVLIAGLLLYPRLTDSTEPPPSEQTQKESPPTASGDTTTARLGPQSVAVLPFEALGKKEPGAFTEGIHDDLLTHLSNISDLQVIARTSVQQYRGTEKTTAEIAEELGVKWVLEGAVQEMENQIQVNAQLIDPRTETHKWAEAYRRDLSAENLFAIQTQVIKRIARSLQATLTPKEEKRVERRTTGNLTAYRLYVEGRTYSEQRTKQGTRRAAEYFVRAIRQDSSYAPAWVGLADVSLVRDSYGYNPLAGSLRVDPERAVRRALAIDSTLAEAHATLGSFYMDVLDMPGALRRLRRAVDLKPSYARAHHWLALVLATMGRLEEAIRTSKRAVSLDPLSPINHLALAGVYFYSGRFERALQEARRAQELAPDLAVAELVRGAVLSALGRQREALPALTGGLERSPPASIYRTVLRAWPAVAHARAGDRAQAQRLLASYEQTPSGDFDRAAVHAALGKREEALEALSEAELTGSWFRVVVFRHAPVFKPLRQTAEYRRALREVNQALGLPPDGSVPEETDPSTHRQ